MPLALYLLTAICAIAAIGGLALIAYAAICNDDRTPPFAVLGLVIAAVCCAGLAGIAYHDAPSCTLHPSSLVEAERLP